MLIRPLRASDRPAVLAMMRTFYASPAVLSDGSDEIFRRDIDACLNGEPFLEGFVFEENGEKAGYAMLAHGFSTEYGKKTVWIEDLYVLPAFRAHGFGKAFFAFLDEKYPDVLFRLEAEKENEIAVRLYEKCGFSVLPYLEMVKDRR